MMKNDTHSMIKIVKKMNVTCMIKYTCKWTGCFFGVVSLTLSLFVQVQLAIFCLDRKKKSALSSYGSVFSALLRLLLNFFELLYDIWTFWNNCRRGKRRKLSLRAGIVIKINASTEHRRQPQTDKQYNLKQKKTIATAIAIGASAIETKSNSFFVVVWFRCNLHAAHPRLQKCDTA